MTRWDLVHKWADPETQSIVDAVTTALENCDRKLMEALARSTPAEALDETARENWRDAVEVLRDALDVQCSGCDHEGIGRPGCRTCDPRTYAYRFPESDR